MIEYPSHWPERHNVCMEPCDMIEGPCVCGAWHNVDELWVKQMIEKHGMVNPNGVSHLSDDEIRSICKECNLVCDREWLKAHFHLCVVCHSKRYNNTREIK